MSTPYQFDVFLSHNGKDKPAVRELKGLLAGQGVSAWVDEEQLRPGLPWQKLLEQAIRTSASVAVLVGQDGIGPWEDEEMRAALTLAVNDQRPVIPVLLPGAAAEPELPLPAPGAELELRIRARNTGAARWPAPLEVRAGDIAEGHLPDVAAGHVSEVRLGLPALLEGSHDLLLAVCNPAGAVVDTLPLALRMGIGPLQLMEVQFAPEAGGEWVECRSLEIMSGPSAAQDSKPVRISRPKTCRYHSAA